MQREGTEEEKAEVAVSTEKGKQKKTHVVPTQISPSDSFNQVLQKLLTAFKVKDATSVRVGQLKSPSVSTFGGADFGTFIKSKGLFPSQIKLYLETNEKFAVDAVDAEDDGNEPDDEEAQAQPRKKTKNIEAYRFNITEIVKGDLLAKGGMAQVFKGTWRGQDVAIKECKADTNQQAQQLAKLMESELEIHLQLSHRNVLSLLGFCRTGTDVLLVGELMHASVDSLLYPGDGPCLLTKDRQLFIIKEMLW